MKVGFVGLGSIGLKHAQVIKEQYPQAELFALRSNVNAIAYPNIANIFSYEDIPSEIDFFYYILTHFYPQGCIIQVINF